MRNATLICLCCSLAVLLAAVPGRAIDDREIPEALRLTAAEAVVMSLENNRALNVQRYEPAVARIREEGLLADFEPTLGARASVEQSRSPGSGDSYRTGNDLSAGASFSQDLETGASLGLDASARVSDSSGDDSVRLEATATQPLMRGRGREVNLVSVRQAALDTRVSDYELRGFAENLVAQVEEAYWDVVLARKQLEIYEQSLELARQQLDETARRIEVGQLAKVELAAAESEAALRQEALINARSRLEVSRLGLLRLLSPPGEGLWDREVDLLDEPAAPVEELGPVNGHVATAVKSRPDLNQARLRLEKGDLELVRTRNGLLPRLDFFITLGRTGYGDSFGKAVEDLGGEGYDVTLGLTAEFPPKRGYDATHRIAILDRRMAGEALDNMTQLAELDVRKAYLEAERLKEQVTATAATRRLQEEKLRAETEKFRVGRSTTFLVAQAQRDLLSSLTAEVEAAASHLKALVELRRLEGSLLTSRGIDVK